MKQRLFAFCAVVALMACVWSGAGLLRERSGPSQPSVPALSPVQETQDAATLAFFGSSTDPWCQPFFQELEQWAGDEGWELIQYDCKGSAAAQQGQAEDLLRTEQARWAVVRLVGDQDQRDELVERLDAAGVGVVVLTDLADGDLPQGARCAVGPDGQGAFAAAAEYFSGAGRVLVLADLADDPRIEPARQTLEDAGLQVPVPGASWGLEQCAADYVNWVLEYQGPVDGVVAFSRVGALGAKGALAGKGAKVLCLESNEETLADLALGRIDGVVQISGQEALREVERVLTALNAGQSPKPQPVKVTICTEP